MVTACEDGLTLGDRDDIISQFWSVWLELEKKLYRRCLKLMNGNVTEAEDALSSARLKAFEQVQKFAGQIRNLNAWLMQLTSNLCIDIIEKHSRGPAGVEDIEWVGDNGVLCTASAVATPMMVLEREELLAVIRRAVESLPQGQRDNFVLHYYEGLKHEEIVERLGISYNSVCQQISKGRKRLKTQLRGYFCDEEELDRALEPKRKKSPTPQGRAKKRKIGSCGSKEKELATVSTAPDGAVGSGLGDCKDGAVEHTAVVGEKMVESMQTGAKLSTATDCAPVGEEKPDLVSGAGVHLAPVGSSMEDGSASLLAQMSEPTPLFIVDKQNILLDDTTGMVSASVSAGSTCTADDVMGVVQVNVEQECTQFCTWWEAREPVRAPVASGELLLFSPLGGETAIKAPECVQVSDIVGENISDVPGLGSAREPSPPDIVELRTRPLSDVLSKETVRAASAIAPVVVDRKPDDVRNVVGADVAPMLSDDGSSVRSQGYTSVSTAREWVPVLDIVGQNIKDVSSKGSARSHSPPGIVEKLTRPLGEVLSLETVRAGSAIAPVAVDRKLSDVRKVVGVDVEPKLSDDCSRGRSQRYPSVSTAPVWVPVLDIVGKNILKVRGKGFDRSHSPPGIVEKRTRPLGEVLSKETVRAGSAIAPVVVDRKLSDVSTVVGVDDAPMLSDDCSRARSQGWTSVSTAPEWVPVLDIVGQNIKDVSSKGSARSHSPPGVEKLTRPLGEELDLETVTVNMVSAIAPVVVEQKPSYVSTVVGVDDAPMLSDDGSRGRSPVTPVARGEKHFCSQLPATVAPEWVPVLDNVGENILDVPGWGCAREPSPPGIEEKRTLPLGEALSSEYGSARSPGRTAMVEKLPIQFSTSREYRGVAMGEILDLVWDALPLWALLGRKINDVCGQGFARSRSPSVTPLASGEKQFCSQLSTTTVSAGIECVPVALGEKPSLKNGAVEQNALVGTHMKEVFAYGFARSHSPMPPVIVEKQTIQFSEKLPKETVTVSAARESPPVDAGEKPEFVCCAVASLALVGQKIKKVCAKGLARAPTPLASRKKQQIYPHNCTV